MKKLLSFSAVMLLLFTACDKIDKLTQFELEYDNSVTIPANTIVNLPINLMTPDIQTNAESKFDSNNTSTDLVEQIVLEQMDLTVNSPSNGDFGFLKSIEIFISADGIPEERIAWQENIPANQGPLLELNTSVQNLKDFIIKDSFSLRVSTTTDETIGSDHDIDIHSVFFVDAKVLGQ